MGRPINSKFFGVSGTGPTASGLEIKVNFKGSSGAVKEGYIVKQLGSKKFRVQEIGSAAGATSDCFLKAEAKPAAINANEMTIQVQASDNETYLVKKIAGRKVTVVSATGNTGGDNDLNNQSLKYVLTGSAAAATSSSIAIVRMEEAGDDNTLSGTDDDDFSENA